MNLEMAIRTAKEFRKETIRELGYLIEELQQDYNRLKNEDEFPEEEHDGLTPQKGNRGFYLRQHCLRYEQTLTASVKMEEWARLADWIKYYEKGN